MMAGLLRQSRPYATRFLRMAAPVLGGLGAIRHIIVTVAAVMLTSRRELYIAARDTKDKNTEVA